MTRFAVFVATTEGPVQVWRISREPLRRAMVLRRGDHTPLPLSRDYEHFTNTVARFFGPSDTTGGARRFRLDVSDRIGDGSSWELAFFLAHAIDADPGSALVEDERTADCVLLASGRVGPDAEFPEPVNRVARKFATAEPGCSRVLAAYARWRRLGLRVVLALGHPADRGALGDTALPPDVALAPAAGDALALCRGLGIQPETVAAVPAAPPTTTAADGRAAAPRRLMAGAALLAVLAAAAGAAWLLYGRDGATPVLAPKPASRPPGPQASATPPADGQGGGGAEARNAGRQGATAPTGAGDAGVPRADGRLPGIEIYERRAPAGRSCAHVLFGSAEAELHAVALTAPDRAADSRADGLCGLAFAVDPGAGPRFVRVELELLGGRLLANQAPPAELRGQSPVSMRTVWSVDLPRRTAGLRYRLHVAASDAPLPAGDLSGAAGLSIAHAVAP